MKQWDAFVTVEDEAKARDNALKKLIPFFEAEGIEPVDAMLAMAYLTKVLSGQGFEMQDLKGDYDKALLEIQRLNKKIQDLLNEMRPDQ